MKFQSTQKKSPSVSLSEAISQGLANDGGLFVPETFPHFKLETFLGSSNLKDIGRIAPQILKPFFEGDPLESHLEEICRNAFNFPLPLKSLEPHTFLLELFHGPTSAFKDFGARFLAECMSHLNQEKLILVATSGDTGGAVASAFYERKGFQVGLLFPEGGISPTQKKQLTCWGENIKSFEVKGTFDDCQRMVKEAFQDEKFKSKWNLSSANSINIGRLLPQSVYYAVSSLWHYETFHEKANYIVPSGNLGNAVAAFWAKEMGFPVGLIDLATNENRVIPDFYKSGKFKPQKSEKTLANAMDVGNPSNLERLRDLYPELPNLRRTSEAISVSDWEIEKTIKECFEKNHEAICPHTATALFFRRMMDPEQNWIVVATAHPAKFKEIVEPLIGQTLDFPENLKKLLDLPNQSQLIEPGLENLWEGLNS